MRNYRYFIDGEGSCGRYENLNELKHHIWIQSDNDRMGYDGMYVFREYNNGDSEAIRVIRILGRKIILSKILITKITKLWQQHSKIR